MTEANAPIAENRPAGTAARIGWAILILATLYVCYFSHLGAIGFVGPDEPRYAWIARDMLETGDWVTPRLYGKPWFEKPPLFYWGAESPRCLPRWRWPGWPCGSTARKRLAGCCFCCPPLSA